MKTRITYMIIAALVVLNLATLATLWLRPQGPPPPDRARTGDFLARELGFDAQQAEQFHQLRETHFTKTRELDRKLRENKHHMIEVLAQNPPDTAEAFTLTQEIGEQSQRMDSLLIEHYLEVQKICTPQQQEQLNRIFLDAIPHPGGPPRRRR